MSVEFYEENAEDFFRRSIDADMAAGWQAFAALLKPGARVLDAGCGSGRDALALSRMGFAVTAMEASPKLATLARAHTGLPVQVLTFDQIAWRDAFDGVWACASLLHVPRAELPAVMTRIRDALVAGGAWWMSFRYGTEERQTPGRRFTDLDEAGAESLLASVGGLSLVSMDVTQDVRPDRAGDRWLSILCQRT
ncbi:class I SAM-dependent methyltransferase [Phenylobacterium sp.]|uniref:class I SAM-dependent methyltransferase n=1 Tax=Phenylobacterium sp. TaxID=1871053 RepID=UPI002EDAAE06